MSTPNGGLINETNAQYYAGSQQKNIIITGVNQTITSTFDTLLTVGDGNYSDPGTNGYNLNNFKIFTSPDASTWTELTPVNTDFDATTNGLSPVANPQIINIVANANITVGPNNTPIFSLINKSTGFIYGNIIGINGANTQLTINKALPTGGLPNATALSVRRITTWTMSSPNIISVPQSLTAGTYLKIQMNEATLNNMHGSYEYTRLVDVIDNFLIAYIGAGKLIPSVKRSDVIFHAKRGLQEFSYDTLKSVKSQELQVPSSLSLIIPQDYVNYTKVSWIDDLGVLHPIYPTNNLNQSPYQTLAQDENGNPIQDSNFVNTETTSPMDAAWNANNPRNISGGFKNDINNANVLNRDYIDASLGQRYGLEPQTSQKNGWFKIDQRKGTFSFTSNLKNKSILLEYISDGNAYDLNARIPKLAEEALYAYIIYSILSVSTGIQEYVVRRFKQEKSAKLRNAKIRLSNLKLDQIVQVMRGKAKWIK
jgi:hypothetical protein